MKITIADFNEAMEYVCNQLQAIANNEKGKFNLELDTIEWINEARESLHGLITDLATYPDKSIKIEVSDED